jgi:hypothetical protein
MHDRAAVQLTHTSALHGFSPAPQPAQEAVLRQAFLPAQQHQQQQVWHQLPQQLPHQVYPGLHELDLSDGRLTML